jgi:L-iditol 2-dehydrogenase
MALCARAAGASPICITDLEQNRLDQAKALGFDRTLLIDLSWSRLQTAEQIRTMMGAGCTPQIAFECTGAASSINAACYVSGNMTIKAARWANWPGFRGWWHASSSRMWKARGGASIDGHGVQRGKRSEMTCDGAPNANGFLVTQVNIVTSFRYQQSWPAVIRLVSEGVLGNVSQLITHTFPVEKMTDAFETCADRRSLAIKVQVSETKFCIRVVWLRRSSFRSSTSKSFQVAYFWVS